MFVILFFPTLPYSCLACLPVVVSLSCCHDVSTSRPLLVSELCCLVNWLSGVEWKRKDYKHVHKGLHLRPTQDTFKKWGKENGFLGLKRGQGFGVAHPHPTYGRVPPWFGGHILGDSTVFSCARYMP